MLDLKEIFYFVQIVERGGFTAASRSLNIPKSTLSYRVQRLENNLSVRLINRTSRRFSATDVGREFYGHAVAMLQSAEVAEGAVRRRLTEPSGTLRFTTAVATAQLAMKEMVPNFIRRFPKVNVIQHATDAYVDIVAENYDVAVRAHTDPLPDSTLVQRTLTSAPWFLFASPSYLERAGSPNTPTELARHSTFFMMRRGVPLTWHMRHPTMGEVSVSIAPRLLSDDMITLKQSAVAGEGIVALPGYICRTELQVGELKRVLPDWLAGESTLTALIPFRQGMLPAVRAFVDFISTEFPKIVRL
jgi:DNA-binding transcriptional LysR family regulator